MHGKTWRRVTAVGLLAALGCSRAEGFLKLDDMEGDGAGVIEWGPPDGWRPGSWFTATDCTQADRISPLPSYAPGGGWMYAALEEPVQTFPGVISAHAAHLSTTSPLTGVWGANMGFDLAVPPGDGGTPPPPPASTDGGAPPIGPGCVQVSSTRTKAVPVDLSAYAGLRLWAKSPQAGTKLYVQLADNNVDPRANKCNQGANGESDCYNHFRTLLSLTDKLTRYDIDFSKLEQDQTWGYRPTPDVPDLKNVYQFTFEVDEAQCGQDPNAMCAGGSVPPLNIDVWVDDVYLVRP